MELVRLGRSLDEYATNWREQQLEDCTDIIMDCCLPCDEKYGNTYFPKKVAQEIANFTVPRIRKRTFVKFKVNSKFERQIGSMTFKVVANFCQSKLQTFVKILGLNFVRCARANTLFLEPTKL